ncbi:MAG TPA: hypothetical protein VK498_05760 [Ferruginibacter sp.]|nr:hypothetical protein [Ferruginibacter sp.]
MQTVAEKNFYKGINKIVLEEAEQLKKTKEGDYTFSDIRYNRLTDLLDDFLREIRDTIAGLSIQGKNSIIDDYLREAKRFKDGWVKDMNDFFIQTPEPPFKIKRLNLRKPFTELNLLIINKLITRLEERKTENLKKTAKPRNDRKLNLQSIFNEKNNAFEVCKGLLEDLEVTVDGKPAMKPGRAGNLMGGIMAIKRTFGMLRTDYTEQQLLNYFNAYLDTKYKRATKRSKSFEENFDTAMRYIKHHFRN